jgi:hypothetical protein
MADGRLKALMAGLVPPGITCSEQIGTLEGGLLGAEAELLSPKTVSKRREEFAAGRTCARAALAMLGLAPNVVLRGLKREPLWPEHVYWQYHALQWLLRRRSDVGVAVPESRH